MAAKARAGRLIGPQYFRETINAARSLLEGTAPEEETFDVELESGDKLSTETGDHVKQESAP